MSTPTDDGDRLHQQAEIDSETATSVAAISRGLDDALRRLDHRETGLHEWEHRLDAREAGLDARHADQNRREQQADQREIDAETASPDRQGR